MATTPSQAIEVRGPKIGLIHQTMGLVSPPYSFRQKYYLVALTAAVVVALAQKGLAAIPIGIVNANVADPTTAQLNALCSMDALVTTLATALLGGLGILLTSGRTIGLGASRLVLASAGCAALSLYLGYVLYLGLLEMLGWSLCLPDLPRIAWVRGAQFYSFLIAVVLFGDFVRQALSMGEAK
jgi:hypothetical protein